MLPSCTPAGVYHELSLCTRCVFGGMCRELQGKLTVPLQPYFEKWAAALARKKVEDAADAHTGARSYVQDCGIPPNLLQAGTEYLY